MYCFLLVFVEHLFPHLLATLLEGDLLVVLVNALHVLLGIHHAALQGLFAANLGLGTHRLFLDGLLGLLTTKRRNMIP